MHRPTRRSRLIALALFSIPLAWQPSRTATAQESGGAGSSLARYIPKDNVAFFIEYDGLDAHADAWQKTAAFKILNTTPTGVMLEELGAQFYDKTTKETAKPNHGGKELVAAIKHVARSGFIYAMIADPKDPAQRSQIVVLRNAFKDKAMRASMAIELQDMNAPNTKFQSLTRLGHKIVSGVTKEGISFSWWVEESKKEDIVVVFGKPEQVDVFLETLDGKRPNLASRPGYADLLKPESRFTPTGVVSFNSEFFKSPQIPATLDLADVTKLDYRWGFQDNALMSITRIATSGPRKGFLSLLDGPTFESSKMPPIPDSVGEFTVVSLDLKTLLDKVVPLVKTFKPDVETQVNGFIDAIKTRTKLRLKEDILPHIGPKMAFFSIPAKAGAKPTPVSGMLGTIMASLGSDQVPKAALVFDIDDPVAFGKVLDQVMVAVNKELKARAAKAISGDAAPTKTSKNRGSSVPSVEFRLMPGENKLYVLTVPPDLSSQFPASFRPAIKVGPKQAVIGVTSEVARLVLETKGGYSASGDTGTAIQGLSSKLKALVVNDPRDSLPELLAALPGNIQKGMNTVVQLRSSGMIPGGPGAMAAQGAGAQPNPGGATPLPSPNAMSAGPGRRGRPGGPDPRQEAGNPGAPGNPAAANAGPGTIVFQIEAAKLPTADSIKALLFPSALAIESNDDEIRIITRGAFPSIPDTSKLTGLWQLGSSWMGLGGGLPAAPAAGAAAGPAAGPNPGVAPRLTPGRTPLNGGGDGRP